MSGAVVGLLGSGEFLPWAVEVDRALLELARAGDGSVAILPTASAPEGDETFERWARMGLDHYASMGVTARVVPVKTRADAEQRETLEAIGGASLVFFSGGNPAYLANTLRDTALWRALTDGLAAGVALAGCSAGACFLGDVAPDPTQMNRIEDAFSIPGLSLFPGLVFGAHWDALDGYYPGLQAIALAGVPDGSRMVGIDEDTAMTTDGTRWRVHGAGGVHVYASEEAAVYRAGDTFTIA